jgi:hypothetical protein
VGSTNFLPFNPTQTNQENDAAWAADSLRVGGIAVDDLLPSPFLNKIWYQAVGGVYALMTMMAAKGFTVNDTNLTTLAAVLANILTTADVPAGLQSVSWASTLALNAAKYSGFQTTLAGPTTITISGQVAGQVIGLLLVQDATGGRAVTYPGNIKGAAQPDPTANVLTAQLFKVDAALNLEAVGPALSVNLASFAGTLSAAAITLAGGAPNGQVLTGNGTSFVPVLAPGYTSGSNANGYWQKDPSGLIRQWGKILGSGSVVTGSTVAFPIAFTNLASVSVNVTGVTILGHGIGFPTVENGTLTLSQFQVEVGAVSPIDGVYWFAVGY